MRAQLNKFTLAMIAAVLLAASAAWAADPVASLSTTKTTAAHSFRSSTIAGMPVYNDKGEEVGKIGELVINIETGRVEYAALSVGGFLGIGDKMFAVPWRLFSLRFGEDKNYFLLDVDKATLEKAPGFDQSHWPNVADPNWAQDIERHYSAGMHSGTFVRFEKNELVMNGDKGEHRHQLAANVAMMADGRTAAMADFKADDPIRVTTAHQGERDVVVRIERLARR